MWRQILMRLLKYPNEESGYDKDEITDSKEIVLSAAAEQFVQNTTTKT